MQKTWVWSLGQEDALEKEMVAWEIPRTAKPGGYSPWGRKKTGMTEWLNHYRHMIVCDEVHLCVLLTSSFLSYDAWWNSLGEDL